MQHNAVGIGSTEDEDDMPYDMYTHDVEEKRSPNDKRTNEVKDEKEEDGGVLPSADAIESPVTNLVS